MLKMGLPPRRRDAQHRVAASRRQAHGGGDAASIMARLSIHVLAKHLARRAR